MAGGYSVETVLTLVPSKNALNVATWAFENLRFGRGRPETGERGLLAKREPATALWVNSMDRSRSKRADFWAFVM
jgi:hypothetical protein